MCLMGGENCTADKQLTLMAMDINLIKTALLGNEFTQHRGAIHTIKEQGEEIDRVREELRKDVETLTKKISDLYREINYRTGFAAGIGATVGLALGILIKLL